MLRDKFRAGNGWEWREGRGGCGVYEKKIGVR